jgi:hypothetical protein
MPSASRSYPSIETSDWVRQHGTAVTPRAVGAPWASVQSLPRIPDLHSDAPAFRPGRPGPWGPAATCSEPSARIIRPWRDTAACGRSSSKPTLQQPRGPGRLSGLPARVGDGPCGPALGSRGAQMEGPPHSSERPINRGRKGGVIRFCAKQSCLGCRYCVQ